MAEKTNTVPVQEWREASPPTAIDEELATNALHTVETNNVRPACFKSTTQEILFVLTATMAIAMSAFLAGSVTVISSFIGRDLHMTTAEVTWISSASSLSSGAFLLFFGKFADLFGRKTLFVGSLFIYAVFALATGFAKTPIGLDVLTGVLGLASASGVPPAVGLLGVIYEKPSRRKNAAFACFSAGNPLGFIFGTIFSGVATSIFNWRASFYLLAIIFLCFAIIGWFTVPNDFTDKEPLNRETLKRFDLLGVGLTIAGIGMFSAALSLGSTAPQGWKTGYVLALLVVGVLLMVGFVFWELWFTYPLVPMNIWRDRNFSLCICIIGLGFFAFTPGAFFIALYFQQVLRMSALMVAVHLLPMAIVGIMVNIFAGMALHRISNKLLMLVGTVSYVITFVLFALNRQSSSYWAFAFPGFIFIVIGADLEFNVANMYVMSSMPREQASIAGAILQTVTRLSQSVGFAICTAIFSAVQEKPSLGSFWDTETQPYTVTFLFALACSVVALALVPFLTLHTQGGKEKKETIDSGGSSVQEASADEKAKVLSTSASA